MKPKIVATVAIAAIALIGLSFAQAQTGGSGTIVLRVPADADVVIGGMKTMQKGPVRTYYTPNLAPGYKYQYDVTVTWTEEGKKRKKREWVDVAPGRITNLDWTVVRKDVEKKKEDPKRAPKDPVKEKKDEIKKDPKKVDVKEKKDPVKEKKDDVKKDPRKVDVKDRKKDRKDDVKKADEREFKQLFNGKDMTGFKENVFEDAKSPFEVKDGAIYVHGQPNGYFYTRDSYRNYVVRFDWKFLKDGNSGLLIHIQDHKGGWPRSVEVQGLQKDHGHIFAIGGAKGSFKTDRAAQKEAIKMGEWNTTEVLSQDGKVTSWINGREISTGESELREGQLGWQSEGVPLLFKNIRIKVLDK